MHEVKSDGYRVQAHKEGLNVRLYRRNGHDFTDRFPSRQRESCLQALIEAAPALQLRVTGLAILNSKRPMLTTSVAADSTRADFASASAARSSASSSLVIGMLRLRLDPPTATTARTLFVSHVIHREAPGAYLRRERPDQ